MTSEEKLLKLIRKKDKADASERAVKDTKGAKKKISKEKEKRSVDFLKSINYILIIAVCGAAGFLLKEYLAQQDEVQTISLNLDDKEVKQSNKKIALPNRQPFDYYQKQISERSIFQNPWEKDAQDTNSPGDQVQPITNLEQNFKLVGIVLDQNDPKAIIENIQGKETLFLSKGEKIGEALLEDIQEGKAIFKQNDKIIELVQ